MLNEIIGLHACIILVKIMYLFNQRKRYFVFELNLISKL